MKGVKNLAIHSAVCWLVYLEGWGGMCAYILIQIYFIYHISPTTPYTNFNNRIFSDFHIADTKLQCNQDKLFEVVALHISFLGNRPTASHTLHSTRPLIKRNCTN